MHLGESTRKKLYSYTFETKGIGTSRVFSGLSNFSLTGIRMIDRVKKQFRHTFLVNVAFGFIEKKNVKENFALFNFSFDLLVSMEKCMFDIYLNLSVKTWKKGVLEP